MKCFTLLLLQNGRLPVCHRPTNGSVIFNASGMGKADVYEKAIELILKDPRHNICEILGVFSPRFQPVNRMDLVE